MVQIVYTAYGSQNTTGYDGEARGKQVSMPQHKLYLLLLVRVNEQKQ